MSKNTKLSWLIKKTDNFNIYYITGSYAETHLDEVIRKEEELLQNLEKYLGVDNSENINLYLYPSLALKKKEWGGKSPWCARYEGRKIIYTYTNEFPFIATHHEETHILCFKWGKPSSYIEGQTLISTASFYEGLAMHTQSKFFNQYFYKYSLNAKPPQGLTLHQAIKPDIENNSAPLTKDILMYKGYTTKLKNGAQLGSIVTFLIEIYGLDRFKKLFISLSEEKSQQENEDVFTEVYGKTIGKVDAEWRSFVLNAKN